ncbi:MAG: ASPIC/UnbV domain-containing protein, partial [Verrucomicrobia bacterium]|nr:ASPIC/UnbV domain-containing protein [Verrucomicrobiota bacterium]
LYHNNGNGNQWLKVKLVGIASNRSAIGAKLRAVATIRGHTIWQMREITGNGGQDGGSEGLVAHFGLGDAATVDTLRIEWPSGIVQELKDLAVNQHLQVVETQGLNLPLPEPLSIQTSERDADGVFHATASCPVEGAVCVLESSSDLERWSKVQVGTSSGGTVQLPDVHAVGSPTTFYRVLVP